MRSKLWKMSVLPAFWLLATAALLPARAADNQNINERVPVNITVPNPCPPGGNVRLSGDLHVVLKIQKSGKGTRVTGHINAQGLRGEGVPSGNRYTASGTGKISTDASALPAEFTVSGRFRLISQGSAPDLHGTATLRVTVQANGNYTVATEQLTLDCK